MFRKKASSGKGEIIAAQVSAAENEIGYKNTVQTHILLWPTGSRLYLTLV